MEQKFTQMAQEALSDAVQNAAALGNPQVDTPAPAGRDAASGNSMPARSSKRQAATRKT